MEFKQKCVKRNEVLFRTMVELPKWNLPMQPQDNIVLLGSCFAQHMGQRFVEYGLSALCNPLGVLYNPESIALLIRRALGGQDVSSSLFQAEGGWRSWWADTMHGGATEQECKAVISERLGMLNHQLRKADYLFVTLGSNVCYRLRETGETVANCHRMPPSMFEETALSLEDCKVLLRGLVADLKEVNPGCRVVFTVSPYRYAKYGLHGSQIAKSTLLLAVDALCRECDGSVIYFPAYEIVLDELRDYRFYASDMLHPSDEATAYIWQCLKECAMSERMQDYLRECDVVLRGKKHRPRNPDSEEYAAFLRNLETKELKLKEKYGVGMISNPI